MKYAALLLSLVAGVLPAAEIQRASLGLITLDQCRPAHPLCLSLSSAELKITTEQNLDGRRLDLGDLRLNDLLLSANPVVISKDHRDKKASVAGANGKTVNVYNLLFSAQLWATT